jgi:hypothetical protein
MTHIHWVTRQNKLEIPIDKDEVNKREIRECDGRENDPDTMVAPLTPKLFWFGFIGERKKIDCLCFFFGF